MPDTVMPVAFRDTALTVVMLGRGRGEPSSFDALRERCTEQVQRLRQALHDGGHPTDVMEDAVYAQCALLDEAALRHLTGADRDAWERHPLQVAEFGTHDAGDALIARMQQRLTQPRPPRPLLAMFLAVLSLGFQGRFVGEGAPARTAMMTALRERLGDAGLDRESVIVRLGAAPAWWARPSLPLAVVLAAAMTVALWLLLDRWLDTVVASLWR